MDYAYIRVSTKDQNEARQRDAMKQIGIVPWNIFCDKQSGKDFERTMYKRLVKRMKNGDVLYVKSIDRLGRDYDGIIEQWRYLVKEKGIDIVVLDMPLLDTRKSKDLLGTFLSDIVLQLLSYVAENERNNIKQRQSEGIKAAKQRGQTFGRPSNPLPSNFQDVVALVDRGEITGMAAADMCGMTRSTFQYQRRKLYGKRQI